MRWLVLHLLSRWGNRGSGWLDHVREVKQLPSGKFGLQTQSWHQSFCFQPINSTVSLSLFDRIFSVLIKRWSISRNVYRKGTGKRKGGRKSNVEEAEAEAEVIVRLGLVTKRKLVWNDKKPKNQLLRKETPWKIQRKVMPWGERERGSDGRSVLLVTKMSGFQSGPDSLVSIVIWLCTYLKQH